MDDHKSYSRSELEQKLCRLLVSLRCARIPRRLFQRACGDQPEWVPSGGLVMRSPSQALVPLWLLDLFRDGDHVVQSRLSSELISFDDPAYIGLTEAGCLQVMSNSPLNRPDNLLTEVFAILAHALPDSHAEIGWEEIDSQLWPIIEAACLPVIMTRKIEPLEFHRTERCVHYFLCYK
jgi:hypothetical protein